MAHVRRGKKRVRAHRNPFATDDFDVPVMPESVNWSAHYPWHFQEDGSPVGGDNHQVTIADIGCGFGGLLVTLGEMFPSKLVLGLEIRKPVVEFVKERIDKLRKESDSGDDPPKFSNISVVRTNIMRYAVNYFQKGQLEKMFILFADPHYKKANNRRRVIGPTYLAYYAFILKEGGLLYTITDVKDLYDWQTKHLDAHPCFERLSEEEMSADPLLKVISEDSEEAKKVARQHGDKFPAIYRRVAPSKRLKDASSE